MAAIAAVVAVLDTSALVAPSHRRDLQIAADKGLFTAVWSPWIVEELARTLTRQFYETHPHTRASRRSLSTAAKRMMTLLTATFATVDPKPPPPEAWPSLTDAGDWPVWAAAKAAGAQYVVSTNTHDYPPAPHTYEGIMYIAPQAFLRLLGLGEDDEDAP